MYMHTCTVYAGHEHAELGILCLILLVLLSKCRRSLLVLAMYALKVMFQCSMCSLTVLVLLFDYALVLLFQSKLSMLILLVSIRFHLLIHLGLSLNNTVVHTCFHILSSTR